MNFEIVATLIYTVGNFVVNYFDSRGLFSTNQLYFFYLYVHKRLQDKNRDKDKTNNLDIQGKCHYFFCHFPHANQTS